MKNTTSHPQVMRPRAALLLVGLPLLAVACASVPAPTAEMAVSEAALNHALSAGAVDGAPMEMGLARDKMARARAALSAGNHELALTLARQAQADARLAEAKTEAAKADKAAAVLREDSRALREEMDRKAK